MLPLDKCLAAFHSLFPSVDHAERDEETDTDCMHHEEIVSHIMTHARNPILEQSTTTSDRSYWKTLARSGTLFKRKTIRFILSTSIGKAMMEKKRVTREQVLEGSKGMLRKQYYVIFSKPTNGMAPVVANIDDHLEHQCKIEREGILVAAGPNWTDDEKYWDGDGMFVYRASSIEHARELAAMDPMHQSGARSFTVRPWLLNEGSLSVRIDFSTGKMALD
jgi:uncharacterized protein YciI